MYIRAERLVLPASVESRAGAAFATVAGALRLSDSVCWYDVSADRLPSSLRSNFDLLGKHLVDANTVNIVNSANGVKSVAVCGSSNHHFCIGGTIVALLHAFAHRSGLRLE